MVKNKKIKRIINEVSRENRYFGILFEDIQKKFETILEAHTLLYKKVKSHDR